MAKVTLDMNAFKALASDTRLEILRALDGKKLNLKELGRVTNLNKATLHEHLAKLNEAGLVKKKERDGHKWVYYKLTWKGEGLLHPENTRIVVMFTTTFITLAVGIIQMINYAKGVIIARAYNYIGADSTLISLEGEVTNTRGGNLFSAPAPECTFDAVSKGATQSTINVPLENQTIDQLSYTVLKNSGKSLDVRNVVWNAEPKADVGYVNITHQFNTYGQKLALEADDATLNIGNGTNETIVDTTHEVVGNVPSSMVAIFYDPTLQYIAIACIAIAIIVCSFAIWRYYKNRKPKL